MDLTFNEKFRRHGLDFLLLMDIGVEGEGKRADDGICSMMIHGITLLKSHNIKNGLDIMLRLV